MTKQWVREASRFVVMCLLWGVMASCGGPAAPVTNDLTYFALELDDNPGLGVDRVGTINDNSVAVVVPSGTDLTALKASFQTTGTKVTVGSVEQTSGVTANNFTTTVTYTVFAANGETHAYSVSVVPQISPTKDLTSMSFLDATNTALSADVVATINGTSVAATVPFGTDVTALVATFVHTGTSVTVGGVAQSSGVTANNFTNPVTYSVMGSDGTSKAYTVTITIAPSTAKDLTAFSFLDATNTALTADVVATINGTAIAATVPFGTDVSALVATFTTTGQSVRVGGTVQVSGTTANNFTAAVSYVVTAADSSTKTYTVTVTIATGTSKDITAFSFLDATNPALSADVTATINGTAIAATVPFGTNVGALVATFTTTGVSVAVGATPQVSGTTPNNFTAAVSYVVTAGDTTTQTYTVTVTIAANPAKDITAFAFLDATNSALSADVTAVINGTAITATVPFGTDVTALIATFSTTGASVAVGATPQASGITPNNFSAAVSYVVTAADTTTKTYTVTITISPSPAKDITAFSFLDATNPALSADVTAVIAGTSITATVPFGTNVTALVATFSTTGASVAVDVTTQSSGITPNNFTSPVSYVVTAADSTTKTYTVTITIASGTAKDITAFSFLDTTNPALSADAIGTINGTAITVYVPLGTNVTALVATFTHTGASVAVGGTPQNSGLTANNFTSPVTYVVTALDSSTKSYTVTVKLPRRFAMPHVRTSAAAAASPVTTILRGAYVALTSPTSATITVRLFNANGVPISGTAGVCNPCTATLTGSSRSLVIDFAAAQAAVGLTAAQDGYAIIDVTGDADLVAISGTTETKPNNGNTTNLDLAQVVEQRATGTQRLFVGPGEENNFNTPSTTGGYDARLTILNVDGVSGANGDVALRLFGVNGGVLMGTSAVCNPCNFSVGPTSGSARTETTVHALRAAAGGTGFAAFLGVADVTGPGAAGVIVIAEKERGTAAPIVTSRSMTPVNPERANTKVFERFVSPEIVQATGLFDVLNVTSFSGLVSGTLPTATVAHKVYNAATRAPLLGNNGQPICNPSCGGTIGAGFQWESSTLANMAAPQGGVPANTHAIIVTEVNGTAAGGVFASRTTEASTPSIESTTNIRAPMKTLIIPHIVETSGTVNSTPFAFDTDLHLAYTGGLPTGTPSSAHVDLFLFDAGTGGPLQATGGAVCQPCAVDLGAANPSKKQMKVDDLITAKGGFDASVKTGFGIIVVSGADPDNVNIQAFVTNSHSGPTDVAVFGFTPTEITSGNP